MSTNVQENINSMKGNRGFTLIEMLVVIAVVGILSATVLTALGPSRNKAKDAAIVTGLQQVRTLAETLYDGDYDAVTAAQTDIKKTVDDNIVKNNATAAFGVNLDPATLSTNFRAYAKLNSGNYYCVDSRGNAGEVGTTIPAVAGAACK